MPAVRPPWPPERVGIGQAGRIVSALPNQPFPETVALWRRMCVVLADPLKEYLHQDAKRILWGIEDEWERRNRLLQSRDEYFRWPTTSAPRGDGSLTTGDWLEVGILRILGYQVGVHNGQPEPVRHVILSQVFSMRLPPMLPSYHMDEWGMPTTSRRLEKMANSIASFCRSADRRNDGSLDVAISEWKADLRYLYDRFYIGRFHFGRRIFELE